MALQQEVAEMTTSPETTCAYDLGELFLVLEQVSTNPENVSTDPGVVATLSKFAWIIALERYGDPETRAAKHEVAMKSFVEENGDMENPLFTMVWLPWAKQVQYIDDRDIEACMRDDSRMTMFNWDFASFFFSWAIPTKKSVQTILKYGNQVNEIGAGTGYCASLIASEGGSVVAVDNASENFLYPYLHIVEEDGVEYLRKNKCLDSTLFLCWPRERFGGAVVDAFGGDTIAWIEEEFGGCTLTMPDDVTWSEVERVKIPTWACVHDFLAVYKRVVPGESIASETGEEESETSGSIADVKAPGSTEAEAFGSAEPQV